MVAPRNTIFQGDALEQLRTLPDGCVQTCVTSPPYWNLRDYGMPGQIGLDPRPSDYVARIVAVFDEVRRVLRSDGTLWLNMGDGYSQDTKWGGASGFRHTADKVGVYARPRARGSSGLKPKDLIGMPWRVAFALQEAGWWLRSDIIWHKSNPMPESVTDRPTKAHEYLFLLTKSERYHYDAGAIREPLAEKTFTTFGIPHQAQGNDALGKVKSDNWGRTVGRREPKVWKMPDGWDTGCGGHGAFHRQGREKGQRREHQAFGANKRTVWTIATEAFPEAHFSTFPQELVEPCILAGSRIGDLVLDPFMGSGTVALVARQWQRDYLGIELNPAYIEMAERRLACVQPKLFANGLAG